MPDIPLAGLFKAWCEKNGIHERSHDFSVARATWVEAFRVAMDAMKQVADKPRK